MGAYAAVGSKSLVAPRILVADPDQGFGMMLAQMLEADCKYVVDYVPSGGQALKLTREKNPQLVIIDAALADMTPPALVAALRQISTGVRIMVIPLSTNLPLEYASLNLQGMLPKPFFADDLPGCIARALGVVVDPAETVPASASTGPLEPSMVAALPVVAEPDARPAKVDRAVTLPIASQPRIATPPRRTAPPPFIQPYAPPTHTAPPPSFHPAAPPTRTAAPDFVRSAASPPSPVARTTARAERYDGHESNLDTALDSLSREISAEALFVIKAGSVVAQRSNMNELRQEAMAELMASWFNIAASMAAFVGERGGRFKQLHFEGERYHIYGFAIADTAVLVAICRSDVAFGSLRLSVKTAGPEIVRHLR